MGSYKSFENGKWWAAFINCTSIMVWLFDPTGTQSSLYYGPVLQHRHQGLQELQMARSTPRDGYQKSTPTPSATIVRSQRDRSYQQSSKASSTSRCRCRVFPCFFSQDYKESAQYRHPIAGVKQSGPNKPLVTQQEIMLRVALREVS